jgi:3-hydroxy-3-methylglutaryl CoA synthase
MIGITGFGGYVPRLRFVRQMAAQANAWYAPNFVGRKGTRSLANWDEDSVTMSVAAARDCLGPTESRDAVRNVVLVSNTLPFAERLNGAIVAGALTLADTTDVIDMGGSQRAALSAVAQAIGRVKAGDGDVLVLASDARKTRAASQQELDYGDAAAAIRIGQDGVLAEFLGSGVQSVDFVDHFRAAGEDVDYHWEERWVRDEGISKLAPGVIRSALEQAKLRPEDVDYFIFPSGFAKMDAQLAKACGIRPDAVVDPLFDQIGDSGLPHGLLLLAHVLERAEPGKVIVLAQFGSGAQALVFRTTNAIGSFRPARGVSRWLARGVEERNYTKLLAFKGQLQLERGMRGEQDKKTALSTAWRHREALLGLVAGRCDVTGSVHFPPSRLSYDQGRPLQDTQKPHKLADRAARILSWSAEYLSYNPAPPHHYGQIDFEGGGRVLMDFTDLDVGDVDSGTAVEMVFRVKDTDERRHFTRYFWKATPVRNIAAV